MKTSHLQQSRSRWQVASLQDNSLSNRFPIKKDSFEVGPQDCFGSRARWWRQRWEWDEQGTVWNRACVLRNRNGKRRGGGGGWRRNSSWPDGEQAKGWQLPRNSIALGELSPYLLLTVATRQRRMNWRMMKRGIIVFCLLNTRLLRRAGSARPLPKSTQFHTSLQAN